jgi:hypothetical protein
MKLIGVLTPPLPQPIVRWRNFLTPSRALIEQRR